MSKILSIDASTEACSVALLYQGEVSEKHQIAPRQHANLLLPSVESLLADAGVGLNQLDAIACHVGPGAFTGIRIGVSVAQGLAYGANLPTIPVSSLYSIAQQSLDESEANIALSAIDARMSEVYFAVFKKDDDGFASLVGEERVVPPQDIEFDPILNQFERQSYVMAGSGWSAYQEIFANQQLDFSLLLENRYPRASAVLKWAQKELEANRLISPAELQPTYLRNQVAKKSAKSH